MEEGREHLEALLAPLGRPSLPSAAGGAGMPPHQQEVRTRALIETGILALHSHDPEAARRCFAAGLEEVRPPGDERLRARCLQGLGEACQRQRELAAAHLYLEEALGLYRRLGDRQNIALSLGVLGDVARDEGDLYRARVLYQEALAIRQELDDGIGTGWLLFRLAHLACMQGNLDRAYPLYEEALASFQDANASIPAAEVLGAMAHVTLMLSKREDMHRRLQTRHALETALQEARAEGRCQEIAATLGLLVEFCVSLGDHDAAWTYGMEARPLMEELGDSDGLMRTLWAMQSIAQARADHATARELVETRLAIGRKFGGSEALIHMLGGMGHQERDEGHYDRSRSLYQESLLLRQEIGNLFAVAQSLEDLAVLAGREQQAERAIRLLGAAEAFCKTLDAQPPVAVAEEYQRTTTEGRAALGEAAFAAAWAEGRAMSLEQAVAYALGEE